MDATVYVDPHDRSDTLNRTYASSVLHHAIQQNHGNKDTSLHYVPWTANEALHIFGWAINSYTMLGGTDVGTKNNEALLILEAASCSVQKVLQLLGILCFSFGDLSKHELGLKPNSEMPTSSKSPGVVTKSLCRTSNKRRQGDQHQDRRDASHPSSQQRPHCCFCLIGTLPSSSQHSDMHPSVAKLHLGLDMQRHARH